MSKKTRSTPGRDEENLGASPSEKVMLATKVLEILTVIVKALAEVFI
ncbi:MULTISPECIES: hypothetical protein [unclassified Corynebacterium]|nr:MULTISPECIES: hypothetical protein [unclassified Corynebacterium]